MACRFVSGEPIPSIAYAVVAALDTRLAVPVAVAEGRPDIAVPAAGRRSCRALAVVVVACLVVAWLVALGAVRIVALLASRRRTLHRRHSSRRAREHSGMPTMISAMFNG